MDYEKKLKPIPDYQKKLKPISASSAPVATPTAKESDKGFLGNLAVDVLRPVARLGTNLINAGQIIAGKEETSPLSGSFFGQVDRVGKDFDVTKGFTPENVRALKDSVGVGAELASNIPIFKGAGIGFDVLKGATKKGGMQVLKKAAVPLIKEGATAGGLMGGGSALQKDKSAGGVLLDTVIGAGTGAAAAPLFGAGAAVGGKVLGKTTNISKLFKGEESKYAKEAAEKKIEDIADYVRGPLSAVEKAKLKAEKRGTEYGGLFGLGNKKFKLGDEDYLMAQATKDLVDPRMSQADLNIDRIQKNVTDEYQNQLLPFLRENPVPYDYKDLVGYLDNKMKPSTLLKNNREAFSNFSDMKKKGLEIIAKFPKTQEGIQNARTAIDNMINDEFGEAIWNKAHPLNSMVKESALKLRSALNDFTHDSIRVGDIGNLNKAESLLKELQKRGIKVDNVADVKEQILKYFGTDILPENELKAILFRQKLRNMNLKLKAADNIWMNSAKEVGKSRFKNLTQDPILRTGAGIGVGYGLSKLFSGSGIGSASGNNSN